MIAGYFNVCQGTGLESDEPLTRRSSLSIWSWRSGMWMLAIAALVATPERCTRPGWGQLARLVGDWNVEITTRNAQRRFEKGIGRSTIRTGVTPCTIVDEL